MKAGDQFFYGPWGGAYCTASFPNDILVMNRDGTSADGINTWKCKSVADTVKLLNGEAVNVIWDNKAGQDKKMVLKDDNTFTVYHGTTPYNFTRRKVS